MEKTDDNISINDSYFLFYHMIYETLQTKNVFDGLDKALDLLRIYLNSGDIVLHRKDSDETYRSFTSQALMKTSIDTITCIINKASKLVESKSTLFIDLNLAESLKNIMILHVKTDDNEYILSINNINTKKTLNADFQHNLEDTLNIILKRADIHEKQVIAITEDPLTKLKNRTAYESRIQTLSEIDEELVYGLFDLFRLKYINDNYSHSLGDKYIIETANILRKYWPKDKPKIQTSDSRINIKTGHELYRIGGDEFVLITTKEKLELTKVKASLASEEVGLIDLGIKDQLPIGLNFGIIKHNPGESIKQGYTNADEIMQKDKKRMYLKYGLDRRR